ncbi:MAG: hypothetical protein NTY38_24505, partial [Acidobacteria bacterium]|nr:hypothetical protein [Acidobacteriota bacterium]
MTHDSIRRRGFLTGLAAAAVLPAAGPPPASISTLLAGSLIWTGHEGLERNTFHAFRHTFEAGPHATSPLLHIFADTRYIAYLDGEYRCSGPARFDPRFPEYDSVPLGATLAPGRHTLVVLVQSLGRSNAWSIAHQPGLTFVVEWQDPMYRVSSGPGTRFLPLDAWDSHAPIGWPSAAEWLDARRLPDAWTAARCDDSAWRHAQCIRHSSWGPFQPRSIPLLTET